MKLISRDTHHIEHHFQEAMLQKLWEPISIGSLHLKNRIALAPIQRLPAEDYWPDMHPTHILYHEAVARGGAGMIVFGEVDITPFSEGAHQSAFAGFHRTKALWSDDFIPGWVKMFEACHKYGAMCFPQLSSYATWRPRIAGTRGGGESELYAPRAEESGMTVELLEAEKWNFVAGAIRAQKAGADGVQITGTRESLVAALVSQVRNPGLPGYCEGLKERVRFPVEVIREIKKACGKDFPVLIRLSAVEYIPGGYDTEYSKLVAKEYVDAGIDAIDVVQAGFSTELPQLQMVAPPGTYAHDSRVVKGYLASLGEPYSKIPIMNACRIQNPWLAASLLRNGDCDMVSICRELIIDPDWPNKLREGRLDDIIPCTGCGWCGGSFTCAVNPQTPYYKSPELIKSLTMKKAEKTKKVVVVGGGMAGMESARALALRGHEVTLYEKENELGRMIRVQSLAPARTDMDLIRIYLSREIRKLGVRVRLGRKATAASIIGQKPDAVIIATGCRPMLPDIPGISKHPHVIFAEDALLENVDVGSKVVVIDAGAGHDLGALGSYAAQFVGRAACQREDVALHIMRWSPQHLSAEVKTMLETPTAREITLVSARDRVADVRGHHYTTTGDLRRMGVKMLLECEYKEITERGLVLAHDGIEELIEADAIITADYEPDDTLYKELQGKVPQLHLVGDAKSVQLNFIANIHGPYRLALTI